jgi:hypothetical protein
MADSKTFEVCLSKKIDGYVADLVKLGLFGESRTAVAQWLIQDGVRRALSSGLIEVKSGRL